MKPWEPQPKESARAYRDFTEYRDLGPDRSLDVVSQKLSKSLPFIKQLSSKNSWVERARVYDAYLDSIRVAARETAQVKLGRKIATADEVKAELTDIALAPWQEFVELKHDKDGDVLSAQLKLTDKIRSLELMGKTHKLFVDKVETVDNTPKDTDDKQFHALIKKIRPDLSNDTIDLLMKESLERIEGNSDKLIG